MKHEPQIRKLTVAQWIAVPDFPGDSGRNRGANCPAHLRTLLNIHENVAMAALPDGSECKIDGHKRANVWLNKLSDKLPDCVTARVFNVESAEELQKLYIAFNQGAH